MLNVLLFGLAASSALVIGAVAGAYWTPPKPLLATSLAFASGALITALAFDLFQESFERGGAWLSAIGVVGGAVSFVVADALLDRYIAEGGSNVMAPNSAFALLAAVTLGDLGDRGPRAFVCHLLLQPSGGVGRGSGDASAGTLQKLRHRSVERHSSRARRCSGARQLRTLRNGNGRGAGGDVALLRRGRGACLAGRHADARRLQGGR